MLGNDQRNLMNQWVLRKKTGLLVELLSTLVQTLLIGVSKLVTSSHLSLDLVLKLSRIQHELVDLLD